MFILTPSTLKERDGGKRGPDKQKTPPLISINGFTQRQYTRDSKGTKNAKYIKASMKKIIKFIIFNLIFSTFSNFSPSQISKFQKFEALCILRRGWGVSHTEVIQGCRKTSFALYRCETSLFSMPNTRSLPANHLRGEFNNLLPPSFYIFILIIRIKSS